MTRTPIEQATIFLSVGRYRRAAEIMLQIIMEQEERLRALELGVQMPVVVTSEYVGTDDADYCKWCKGPCKRNFCIYCGADHKDCKCE